MQQKKKQQQQRRKTPKPQPKKKATPFGDVGQIVGSRVGQMFGNKNIGGIGRWLGSGIGSIFGSGDYTTVGPSSAYNVLTNNSQIPKFDSTRSTNVVCHREYLGDITGTAGFNNTQYPLNPGLVQTFPWLSTVAQNYQEYRFHGLVFEFRPLITDFVTGGAPGVVVMATNYNAASASYVSKQEMENSEFAVSVKPTMALMHGIECAAAQTVLTKAYVRTGSVPTGQDQRLYDLATFQFATQANPVVNLGELWVSYCVELFKPILPADVGGDVQSQILTRGLPTSVAPLGPVSQPYKNSGDLLNFSATATVLTFYAQPGNAYSIAINWIGGTAGLTTYPAYTAVGLVPRTILDNGNSANTVAPPVGTSSTNMMNNSYWTCSLTSPGNVTVTLAAGGIFPSGANNYVNTVITQLSDIVV